MNKEVLQDGKIEELSFRRHLQIFVSIQKASENYLNLRKFDMTRNV